MPASRASSTTYWINGRSTMVSISFGIALVAGRTRVPRPATGNTALRIFMRSLQRGSNRNAGVVAVFGKGKHCDGWLRSPALGFVTGKNAFVKLIETGPGPPCFGEIRVGTGLR